MKRLEWIASIAVCYVVLLMWAPVFMYTREIIALAWQIAEEALR